MCTKTLKTGENYSVCSENHAENEHDHCVRNDRRPRSERVFSSLLNSLLDDL